jgi:hypothetical protein
VRRWFYLVFFFFETEWFFEYFPMVFCSLSNVGQIILSGEQAGAGEVSAVFRAWVGNLSEKLGQGGQGCFA